MIKVDIEGAEVLMLHGAAELLRAHHPVLIMEGNAEAVRRFGTTPTVLLTLASLRRGGTAVMVGNVASTTEFPLHTVVTRELRLLGSCASAGEYPLCLDLISRGVIQVKDMISAVAPLSEGPEWFRRLSAADGFP